MTLITQPLALSPSPRFGELRLRFALRDGRTILKERYFKTPLQVMRAIPDAAGCLGVYMLSPTGGVVQGDEYNIHIVAESGTHALITTQSATKIYRMPERGAIQCVQIEVFPGAVLEYMPDAAILFAEADYTQEMHVRLHPGALFMLQEIVMPGRLARGEILNFKRYRNRVIVHDSKGLLLYDSVDYAPKPDDSGRLGLLDNAGPCWGSWYLLGDLAAWETKAADFCAVHHESFYDADRALGGLSALHRDGIAARMVAPSLSPIYAGFNHLWATVRTEILHLPASTIRK